MYLFEIRDIKYTRKCILSSKSQTGIEYLWACYNSVLRYYIILGFQNIKEIIVFLLLKVQTNTIFATMEFEHLNKSN